MIRRLLLLAAVCAACKSSAPADAGTEAAAPPPSVAGATALVVHDVSRAPGAEHDVVIELTRSGAEIAWVAKLTDRANAFGEPEPDGTLVDGGAPCTCPVRDACACEDLHGAELIRKSGTIPPAAFDAFLTAIEKSNWAPDVVGDDGPDGRVHVAVRMPAGKAIHLERPNDARAWRVMGQALGQKSLTDNAWQRLLDAMGARAWIAALYPLPAVITPRGFAELAKVDALEIDDVRLPDDGGTGWSIQARLERSGAAFTWRGKVAKTGASLVTSAPDRAVTHDRPLCVCGIDERCACEGAVEAKSGTIPAKVVDAFLALVSKHELGASTLSGWSGDLTRSAEAHVVLWPAGASPIHLSRLTSDRVWGVNGRTLAPEPKDDPRAHAPISTAYVAVLSAIAGKELAVR